MRLSIAIISFVLFGLWVVQTDHFPLTQGIQPSWYVYGWPICFATSSRDRFGFSTFQLFPLIVDLVIAVFMLFCTCWITRILLRQNTFTLSDLLAGTVGLALTLTAVTGSLFTLLELASFPVPMHGCSVMDGESRPLYRIPIIAVPAICFGIFSIGYIVSSAILQIVGNYKAAPSRNPNA